MALILLTINDRCGCTHTPRCAQHSVNSIRSINHGNLLAVQTHRAFKNSGIRTRNPWSRGRKCQAPCPWLQPAQVPNRSANSRSPWVSPPPLAPRPPSSHGGLPSSQWPRPNTGGETGGNHASEYINKYNQSINTPRHQSINQRFLRLGAGMLQALGLFLRLLGA